MRWLTGIAATAVLALGIGAAAAQTKPFKLGIVAFQMSSETHARTANAALAAAKALGWDAAVQNSAGDMAQHVAQIDNLVTAKADGIVICMGKPVETDAQLAAAKKAGIPVIMIMGGTSPHILFDIQVNEYKVGADAALDILGRINYRGNLLTAALRSQCRHADSRQGARSGAVGKYRGESRRHAFDGADGGLERRRAGRHVGAAAAEQGQDQRDLGLV